jgi:hypothetical protein
MNAIRCNVPFGSRESLGGAVGAEEFGGTGVGLCLAMMVILRTAGTKYRDCTMLY